MTQSSPANLATRLTGIWQVTVQELRSSLRDRQTVMNSVVLPIVMYPIMFWLILQGFLVVQGHKERTQVEVTLVGSPEQVALVKQEFEAFSQPKGEDMPAANILFVSDWTAGLEDDSLRNALLAESEDPALEPTDAILRLPDASGEGSHLFLESTRSHSELAADRVQSLTSQLRSNLRKKAAQEKGLSAAQLDPLDVRSSAVTASRDQGAFILSMFLPMMIVFMAVMGAFFPAVDSTAGEKERGTAETTLLIPIPRAHVLLGKILATTALAFLATILNLIFMGLAARHLLGTLGGSIPIEIEFPFMALLLSMPLVLLFCFFVAAVLTALAGLTKSFKEGQAMLGPAQMVFILPAIIGIMPGLKLSLGWALVPVVNVVLAVRAILVMEWLPIPYLVTGLVLLASAWIAVRICVRLLSQEALAFAGSSMSIKQLLRKARHAKS